MYGTPNSSSSCITSLRMASETVSASLAALRAASCNSTRSSLVIGQGMSVSGGETHASRWKGTTGRMMNPPDDPRFMYRGRWQLMPGEGERTHKGKKQPARHNTHSRSAIDSSATEASGAAAEGLPGGACTKCNARARTHTCVQHGSHLLSVVATKG
jgi:hypothetical protein